MSAIADFAHSCQSRWRLLGTLMILAAFAASACAGCDRSADGKPTTHASRGESDLPAPESSMGGVLDVQHERPTATIVPAQQPELIAVPGPMDAGAPVMDNGEQTDSDLAISDATDTLRSAHAEMSTDAGSDTVFNTTGAAQPSAQGAVDAIRGYYAALNSRRYAQAYSAWANNGGASGQTPQQFTDGYATTASIDVQIMAPSRIEGAAGSRYVQVPVRLTALQTDGSQRQFGGSYTLRASVVEGGDPAWHIASANLREIPN